MSYQVRTINYRFSNTGFGFQRLGLCYLNQVVLSGTGDRNTQQRWIISQLSKSPQVHFVQHPSPPCRTFTAEKVACTVQVSARSLPLSRSSCTGNDPPPVYLTIHVRILQGWHLAPIQMRTVSALRCRPCLDGGFITAASSAPPPSFAAASNITSRLLKASTQGKGIKITREELSTSINKETSKCP